MGDNHLEEVVCLANNLTDGQMRQAEENLGTLDERAKKVTLKVKKTVKSLRAAAEKLDDVWAKHYIAHACGTSFGVIGGFLTVGGGIATLMTAGAASPLLIAGLGFGVTGASTNVIAKVLESAITEANKDLKETYDIDLGFTINDLVKNKGSEAAKRLREKADELEALYITIQ